MMGKKAAKNKGNSAENKDLIDQLISALSSDGNGKGKGKGRNKSQPNFENKDPDQVKKDVMALLEEKGGYCELSELGSRANVRRLELVELGFQFGPPNEARELFVFAPDASEVDIASMIPPVRKSNKSKPAKKTTEVEQRSTDEIKNEVIAILNENYGHLELSEIGSRTKVKKKDLELAGFKFGPPNGQGDFYVFLPDTKKNVSALIPTDREPRKSEGEVLPELLDFLDEHGGHAPLRDIHRKFKLKEKPKTRLEALGFTFGDNADFGGCEVYMPDEAKGKKRLAFIDKHLVVTAAKKAKVSPGLQ